MRTLNEILQRVEKTDSCWLWRGCICNGYGHANWHGKVRRVHRIVYEAMVGPIPEGHALHHECEVKSCVNPDHVRPILNSEHARISGSQAYKNRTTCRRGHPYTPENTYNNPRGARECRTCKRANLLRYRERKRKAVAWGT